MLTLFALCGMLVTGTLLPDGDGTRLGVYPGVPFPAIGLLFAFGLLSLDLVRRDLHPLTLLPGLAAAVASLILSDTPLLSTPYTPTLLQMMPAALVLLGLFLCVGYMGLPAPHRQFDGRMALLLAALIAVLFAAGYLEQWLQGLQQDVVMRHVMHGGTSGRLPLSYLLFSLEALLLLATGTAAWPLLQRGRRAAGIALLSLGGLSLVWALLLALVPPVLPFAQAHLSPYLYNSHVDLRILSYTGVVLTAGIKACLPEVNKAT